MNVLSWLSRTFLYLCESFISDVILPCWPNIITLCPKVCHLWVHNYLGEQREYYAVRPANLYHDIWARLLCNSVSISFLCCFFICGGKREKHQKAPLTIASFSFFLLFIVNNFFSATMLCTIYSSIFQYLS